MENILAAVLNAQGGGAAAEAGQTVGLSPEQTSTALSALVPALASGLSRNASLPGGLDSLLGALTGGAHSRYVDDPSALRNPEAVTDGNAILGHILGSKDASRAVASQAAAQTGLGEDVLKKLLPMAATLVMGSLSKQGLGAAAATAAVPGAGILAMLKPMLDRDRDGSMVDDVIGQVGKLFGR
jgi:hypothetical protein